MATTAYETGRTPGRQYLEFNGISSREFLLYLSGPGVYDAPAPDVSTTSIPGLNGDLITDNARMGLRRFQNVNIQYDAFFFNGLPAKTAAVKSWLLSPAGYQKLKDSYDPDFFRMAMCTSALTFQVTRQQAAEVELTFNCKPQRWSEAGQEAVTLDSSGSVLENPYAFHAQPLIRVYGDGEGELTIGDHSVVLYSIDGYVDLNCETQNAYNADGFCNDTIYSEDFPLLAPGENTIVWDSGISSVEITPRWWTL
ncbi:MAG: hypothetical protein LUI10_07495 [Lachnospiraceae bacterium]|nr:hypothetical protein [Lachnospiraceae bacterium]